ncbi:MAG: zinc ribbon domain-containing protein [Acidobacteria bacterium]|nr:zinc ribbon domain-containing protein [Acidobacteriota bacterium]
MPIYEYRCADCADRFDVLLRTMNADGVKCPSCGSTRVTRLVSTFAVSHGLTPCGSRASEAAPSCGLGAGDDGCASCCRLNG